MKSLRPDYKTLPPLTLSTGVALVCALVASIGLSGCSVSGEAGPSLVSFQSPESGAEQTSTAPTTGQIEVTVLGPERSVSTSPVAEAPQVIVASARRDGQIVAREEPSDEAPTIGAFQNPTSIGAPLVFQAVDDQLSTDKEWIEVLLPMRPNGSTGWIRLSQVELALNPYRIEVRPELYELSLFRENQLVFTTAVGIGTGTTPTPRGRFYIIELLETLDPDGPYGPFAFGLSGFSETLQTFAGGDGVIGIHGTNDPQALGTDVSHGCIRIDNDVVVELSAILPLGTPVIIGP